MVGLMFITTGITYPIISDKTCGKSSAISKTFHIMHTYDIHIY